MRIEKVEVEGFRGLVKEELQLTNLTVMQGPMGSGKTSKLLAILFGLTGSVPSGLTLDDMIHIDADAMWIALTFSQDGETQRTERRKRRGLSTVTRGKLPHIALSEKIFIEGREISRLFTGTTSERTLMIDALLGLSGYSQLVTEMSISPVENKINDLFERKEAVKKATELGENLTRVDSEIGSLEARAQETDDTLSKDSQLYTWAEEIEKRARDEETKIAEIEGKRRMTGVYKNQLSTIKPFPEGLEEEYRELEARHQGMQRRITFLEAAMQALDLEGKEIEKITTCPLCGSPISPGALERFKHYDGEYKDLISRYSELDNLLSDKRRQYETARKDRERASFLQGQIASLESSLNEMGAETLRVEDREKAGKILTMRRSLLEEKRILDLRRKNLMEQKAMILSLREKAKDFTDEEIEKKIGGLKELKESITRIKSAILESVNEVRNEQLSGLRESFREAFKKIYPYERFTDVDFETGIVRGKDALSVKAKKDGSWIYSRQMSTGENVGLSFALLYAVNELEKTSILLLDEPEEGLDDEGIKGLADVLKRLSSTTQLVIATRSSRLAQLLKE